MDHVGKVFDLEMHAIKSVLTLSEGELAEESLRVVCNYNYTMMFGEWDEGLGENSSQPILPLYKARQVPSHGTTSASLLIEHTESSYDARMVSFSCQH